MTLRKNMIFTEQLTGCKRVDSQVFLKRLQHTLFLNPAANTVSGIIGTYPNQHSCFFLEGQKSFSKSGATALHPCHISPCSEGPLDIKCMTLDQKRHQRYSYSYVIIIIKGSVIVLLHMYINVQWDTMSG